MNVIINPFPELLLTMSRTHQLLHQLLSLNLLLQFPPRLLSQLVPLLFNIHSLQRSFKYLLVLAEKHIDDPAMLENLISGSVLVGHELVEVVLHCVHVLLQ